MVAKVQRFFLLDGLRGLAAFGVLSFHYWLGKMHWASGFNLFVDFFFVLSGFVLAPSLLNSTATHKKRFLVNRIIRLWPMLIAVFGFIILFNSIPYTITRFSLNPTPEILQFFGAFFLLQIFWSGFVSINTPLWSLSAEWFTNVLATLHSTKTKTLKSIIALGLIVEFIALYSNDYFELNWEIIHYFIAVGRATVGFYLGLVLRGNLEGTNKSYKGNLGRLLLCLILFG